MPLDGLSEMLAVMDGMADQVRDATPDALEGAAAELTGAAMGLLSAQSHEPGTPTPSSPGSPPAQITGDLTSSIVPSDIAGNGDVWSIEVGPTTVYARIQELGGDTGKGYRTTLLARPYMAPALDSVQDSIGDIFASAWGEALG